MPFMISVISSNKALECAKLVIRASDVGSRKFLIASEGSINSYDNTGGKKRIHVLTDV